VAGWLAALDGDKLQALTHGLRGLLRVAPEAERG